jgi:hypothetical protein
MNKAVQFDLLRVKYLSLRICFEKEGNLVILASIEDEGVVARFIKCNVFLEIAKHEV